MLIIKNSEELKQHLNEHKDLIVPNEDVRIEYQVEKGELRNVECGDLFLMDDKQRFDFNGGNFNGRDFNGWNFNGVDFNGGNFNGGNFNGWNFNGKKISYYAVFIAYESIKCTEIKGRRENAFHKCLDGEIEIIA